jgi:hypothetical protein
MRLPLNATQRHVRLAETLADDDVLSAGSDAEMLLE